MHKRTLPSLAEFIGVTKQRVHKLKDEGRIPSAVQGVGGRYTVDWDPQILRGNRERPGPVTEFIKDWEMRNSVSPEDNTLT
jgi:hypothetical protein